MSQPADEATRRAYWTEQMEAAHEFMRRIMDYPVEECGEGVAPLPEAVAEAGVEAAFSELPHAEGLPRLFYLREGLVGAFLDCAREMNERGWMLKIEDGFRTREMQTKLARRPETFDAILRRVLWECGGEMPDAQFVLRRVSVLVACAPKVGTHMSASALDVSVLRRDDGAEVPRGGPYLEMSERTPMDSPFVSDDASAARREITDLMAAHGFVAYPWEFWHYSRGDAFDEYFGGEERPARYGPVDVDLHNGSVTPMADAKAPLNSRDDIAELVRQAMGRMESREPNEGEPDGKR